MADITYAEYWTEVERIAKEVIKEYKDPENEEGLSGLIINYTSGHKWVEYYHSNYDVLKHSRYESYGLDVGVVESEVKDFNRFLSSMAEWAMDADILDMVNHLGVFEKEESDV